MGVESGFRPWHRQESLNLGYRKNPLEEMAFRHQARFEIGGKPYDIVSEISKEISNLPENIFDFKKI
jgi:hypothetical protein